MKEVKTNKQTQKHLQNNTSLTVPPSRILRSISLKLHDKRILCEIFYVNLKSKKRLKPFHATVLFLYPLKTSEKPLVF